jgi:alpha-beta hydrolase superfamily lysophospholipase
VAYSIWARGRVQVGQVLITCYAVLCVVCLLWGLNVLLKNGYDALFRVRRYRRGGARAAAAQVIRAATLYAIALPYLAGIAVVYRPKVAHAGDPTSLLNVPYERVAFNATDGQRVVAWWIPAGTEGTGSVADRTVLLCHGFLADKAEELHLARDLVPAGFNVLAIDLRGHGESGGQLVGFGHAERCDVLGAVRWLRTNRPQACHRLFGVGRSLGSAALLAAAADPSTEGQSIDGLALYSAYDSPEAVVHQASSWLLVPPLDTVVERAAMPVAGVLSGGGLDNGSPLRDVQRVWPRPILFIHGQSDRSVPFDSGRNLYDHALQPKYYFWLPRADSKQVVDDPTVSQAVRLFFEFAKTIL